MGTSLPFLLRFPQLYVNFISNHSCSFPHQPCSIVQKSQLKMDKSQVKTIGFSLLRQPGEFELEIDHIAAVNTDLAIGDYDIELPTKQVILEETEKRFQELNKTEEKQMMLDGAAEKRLQEHHDEKQQK
jgi:hypothetical protein